VNTNLCMSFTTNTVSDAVNRVAILTPEYIRQYGVSHFVAGIFWLVAGIFWLVIAIVCYIVMIILGNKITRVIEERKSSEDQALFIIAFVVMFFITIACLVSGIDMIQEGLAPLVSLGIKQ